MFHVQHGETGHGSRGREGRLACAQGNPHQSVENALRPPPLTPLRACFDACILTDAEGRSVGGILATQGLSPLVLSLSKHEHPVSTAGLWATSPGRPGGKHGAGRI